MTEHHPAPRRVVVDTDTGIDDALALLWLARRPDVEISAVTSVYGNCSVDDALRNIGHVLALAGLPDVPVAAGAPGPVDGRPAHIASYVHGIDGLGDLGLQRTTPAVVGPTSAEYLVELADSAPGEYDLLPLGPLSNLALALELDPLVLTKFRSTVLMGGSGPFPPVGVTQTVDANIANDPAAARAVFAAPRSELVMVGVNAGAQTIVDEAAVQALHRSGDPVGEFCAAVLESYMDFYQYAWGRRISPAWDGLTAGLLVEPRWITASIDGPVAVVPDGLLARAHLLQTADGLPVPFAQEEARTAPATTVVTGVDAAGFLADFVGRLAGVR
ncbi:nucleoside hydrolase [Trujillonella endophytica]|uniref:Purine nucleosidase n=1 Tax=Trujillonella endophytica TaxID=673521 RepID=A0A1H8WQ76_9ACTN|nr:nucleoside hydrolase [Trujillella endophytica]SEP29238.1 purine nucleosidase [Trujillella endophytica]